MKRKTNFNILLATGIFLAVIIAGYCLSTPLSHKRSDREICVDHLKEIGLQARAWAVLNETNFPPTLNLLDEDIQEGTLICPAMAKTPGTNSPSGSYIVLSPRLTLDKQQFSYVWCPFHHLAANGKGDVYPKEAQ